MEKVNYKVRMQEDGISKLPSCSFPGGYPLFYLIGDNFTACADCATVMAGDVTSHHVHWEGEPIVCEYCNAEIASAYGACEEE